MVTNIRHCNIPIFIPELACPHRCIFCNQNKISGVQNIPSPEDIPQIVNRYLATLDENCITQIAFFGGSFTGIPEELQEAYLSVAYRFVADGKVEGIRLSTRPDYINERILDRLKRYGVKCVELGAQSFDERVLRLSGRGHRPEDTIRSSALIKDYGIELGLQMMIGLPGDSREIALRTVDKIIEMGASNTRIYPTLVIKDTPLHRLYERGEYVPLTLDEAIETAKDAFVRFSEHDVTILRIGLHPSEELSTDKSLIAGPYHPSFRELVLGKWWLDRLLEKIGNRRGKLQIEVPAEQINYVVGYNGVNRKKLREQYGWIKIKINDSLTGSDFRFEYL